MLRRQRGVARRRVVRSVSSSVFTVRNQIIPHASRLRVLRSEYALHDSERILEHLKRLALVVGGRVSVQGRARKILAQRQRDIVFSTCLVRHDEVLIEDAKRQAQRKIDHIVKTKPNMTNDEISDEVDQFWAIGLSCKLCKKPHDAIILHALGWGYWKNCASKADRPLPEDYTKISAALTYLGICLTESGRHAEALEVQRAFVAWTVKTTGSSTVEEVIRNSR